MFSVLMQTFWLLFGSGAEISNPPEFVSCRSWTHEGVVVAPVWCLCHTFGQFEFCAGDLAAPVPLLEIYPLLEDGARPYLRLRLGLQGD
jgi:hypothetical protein